MDILSRFRFPGFFERRKAPRPAERSEQPAQDEERPRFVGLIPLVVPLAAVVLATLVYYIFWASWSY
jgi:hypothetical protein